MQEESVEFFSEGTRVRGILRTADDAGPGPLPAIVQGPGWLGLKDSKLYVRYHEALTAAGFAVLIFDYRGFGDSDGDKGLLLPSLHDDLTVAAKLFDEVTYGELAGSSEDYATVSALDDTLQTTEPALSSV